MKSFTRLLIAVTAAGVLTLPAWGQGNSASTLTGNTGLTSVSNTSTQANPTDGSTNVGVGQVNLNANIQAGGQFIVSTPFTATAQGGPITNSGASLAVATNSNTTNAGVAATFNESQTNNTSQQGNGFASVSHASSGVGPATSVAVAKSIKPRNHI